MENPSQTYNTPCMVKLHITQQQQAITHPIITTVTLLKQSIKSEKLIMHEEQKGSEEPLTSPGNFFARLWAAYNTFHPLRA